MPDKPIKHVITPASLREMQDLGAEHMIPDGVTVSDPNDDDPDDERILVCARKGDFTPFTDNLEGNCATCNTALIYRPHTPKDIIRMCIRCANIRIGQESAQ